MKVKNVVLVVLACALVTGAAQAAARDLAAPAPLVLLPAASSCASPGVTLLPAAPQALRLFPNCGACSTGSCANIRMGAQCGVQGMYILYCTEQGFNCSQDGRPACACTTGEH